jgi:hypothetical protein
MSELLVLAEQCESAAEALLARSGVVGPRREAVLCLGAVVVVLRAAVDAVEAGAVGVGAVGVGAVGVGGAEGVGEATSVMLGARFADVGRRCRAAGAGLARGGETERDQAAAALREAASVLRRVVHAAAPEPRS